MQNTTIFYDLPPLPTYTLKPLPPLIPVIPDKYLQLLAIVVAYWAASIIFHLIDTYDIFPQYRLHTPAEILKRNHVTRYEVLRDVIIQQVVQTLFGVVMNSMDPEETTGREHFDEAVWAQRIRLAQRFIPSILSVVGLDSMQMAARLGGSYPMIAGALSGGLYPSLLQKATSTTGEAALLPAFAAWEVFAAKAIYWVLIPLIQFTVAAFIVDTWQYFLHRWMHMNKWLYTTLHSRHHRLYVPYAYGALYNHPIEGFLLDTLGTGLAYLATLMSTRQGLVFFSVSAIKTVDDHCGYAFPWDPLQCFTNNNAAYHDVHHQSWGIKANFSQPFTTFWDRALGTTWTGGDVSARYERSRIAAQKKVDVDQDVRTAPITRSPATDIHKAAEQAKDSKLQVEKESDHNGAQALKAEVAEEIQTRHVMSKNPRQKRVSVDPKSDSLRGLRDRVTGIAGKTCT
ncbi:MAG: hypothetical protein Q9160_002733 [Pyrenula sp. 1 TL-2023]